MSKRKYPVSDRRIWNYYSGSGSEQAKKVPEPTGIAPTGHSTDLKGETDRESGG
jgi:hypothetical protein